MHSSPSSSVVSGRLESLTPGQIVPFGGDRYVTVDPDLANRFRPGDRLVVVQDTGELLHVPGSVAELVSSAVSGAVDAFRALQSTPLTAVDAFYESFARSLEDDSMFSIVRLANEQDVDSARRQGRGTGRLELTPKMRADMIAALRMWRDLPDPFSESTHRVEHESWSVEERRSPLGVVGFVFEGRPNVFADATGVLKSRNSVVFRIGSDALGTARAMMDSCVRPALVSAGLPFESVVLVDSPERAAGHALFADSRLALAVARGSGAAVAQLGAVARQAGVPVSLHGTGGAWMHVAEDVDGQRVRDVVDASLDRKVCNTVNVIAVPRGRSDLHAAALDGIRSAASRRSVSASVHVSTSDRGALHGLLDDVIVVEHDGLDHLGTEWEWDEAPEVSLILVEHVDRTIELFDSFSPRFVMSVVSDDSLLVEYVYDRAEAPFVGDGFTRWVDGQYALGRPELGLSNWQNGRLFGRGGILSGDGVFSVRYRTHHRNPRQRR